jgi:hypothetical protein
MLILKGEEKKTKRKAGSMWGKAPVLGSAVALGGEEARG